MKRVLIILMLCVSAKANAHFPLTDADHLRRAKINKGLGIGVGATGVGLLLYTGTRNIVQNAYWNDQEAHWNFQRNSGLITADEYSKQMLNVKNGRDDLRTEMRRNYAISGGLVVLSMGFFLNAHRHAMKINEETTLFVRPDGVAVVYRFSCR